MSAACTIRVERLPKEFAEGFKFLMVRVSLSPKEQPVGDVSFEPPRLQVEEAL